MSRLMGVDFGLKRIGIAFSDERKIIASSFGKILVGKNSEETCKKILQLIEEHDVEKIVLGNPLHMDGKMSFLSDEVKHFKELLQTKTEIPIVLWDERLTSVQAQRTLQSSGMSRKKRAKVVDTVAAVILLQSYLDSQSLI